MVRVQGSGSTLFHDPSNWPWITALTLLRIRCIARNLASMELVLATRAIARENVLDGAHPIGDTIELMQWFNSKVKGEKIELTWQ